MGYTYEKNNILPVIIILLIIVLGWCEIGRSKIQNQLSYTAVPIESTVPESTVPENTLEEIAVITDANGISSLDNYPYLKKADLSGSTCYDAIMQYISSHPDVEVIYNIAICGDGEDVILNNYDDSADFPDCSYCSALIDNIIYLPILSRINLGEVNDICSLSQLFSVCSGAEIFYNISILGKIYNQSTENINISSADDSQIEASIANLTSSQA